MTKSRFNVGDMIIHKQPFNFNDVWIIKGKIIEILDNDVVIIEVENENYTRILITSEEYTKVIDKEK